MKKLFLSIISLLISISAFSASIKGTVFLEDELDGVVGASVCICDSNNRVIAKCSTDTEGKFDLSFSGNESPVILVISYVGYQTDTTLIPCNPELVINVSITLKKDTGMLF